MVERRVNDGPFEPVVRMFPDRTRFRDMQLEEGNEYAYRVAAFNLAGLSAYTETVAAEA